MDNRMEIRIAANMQNEIIVRVSISAFLLSYNISLNLLSEIKTILSEAVSNAIIHGYHEDDSYDVIVKVLVENDILHLQIIDEGEGIEDIELASSMHYTTAPEKERAGMGITIMESLSDTFSLTSLVNVGTKITLTKSLKENEVTI